MTDGSVIEEVYENMSHYGIYRTEKEIIDKRYDYIKKQLVEV